MCVCSCGIDFCLKEKSPYIVAVLLPFGVCANIFLSKDCKAYPSSFKIPLSLWLRQILRLLIPDFLEWIIRFSARHFIRLVHWPLILLDSLQTLFRTACIHECSWRELSDKHQQASSSPNGTYPLVCPWSRDITSNKTWRVRNRFFQEHFFIQVFLWICRVSACSKCLSIQYEDIREVRIHRWKT